MNYLIITVAGTATRFNKDTDKETLKCLFYKGEPKYSLLSQIFANCSLYDKYIIVGGYLFEQLKQFIENELSEYSDKITLIYNEHYNDYGSGYSLYKGIKSITIPGYITFVEGDLFFSESDFRPVYDSDIDVITINRDPIYSNKAVALYINTEGSPRYIYDTNHKALMIHEPFTAIFNSGQIWKFTSFDKLLKVIDNLTNDQLRGTNLEIIQAYFSNVNSQDYKLITFNRWYNCNTVADYNFVRRLM